jgi:hypothetical protein
MNSVGESPTPAPDGAAGGPADAPVHDQLLAIDTAALEQMLALRGEQARIDAYRQRAEENRAKVEPAVWQRVTADYASRHAALERQIVPLKAQVRAAFQQVQALLDRVTRASDDARLQKEEIEFRHDVGELDDTELASAAGTPARVLEQCRCDLAEIEALKARFLEAFVPGEEMPAPAAAPGPEPSAGPPPPASAPTPAAAPSPAQAPAAASAPPPADVAAEAGMAVGPEAERTFSDLDRIPAAESTGTAERTFMIPLAALIADPSDGGVQAEYRLGAQNVIGRSNDAQIQLSGPGVSRRHALVSIGPSGFTIRDLKSQNGTLVNGERITEVLLTDGDRVQIGEVQLTFLAPWPIS